MTDGESVDVDLSGGFFDAGNFIKAILPLSWTLTSMAHAALLWGDSFTAADQTYYLDQTLRNGLDWIMAASSVNDTLFVNIGTQDDVYWGGDLDIPQPREVFNVSRENPGTDVFAAAATALSAASLLYQGIPLQLSEGYNGTIPTGLVNTTYAAELSARAVVLMELALTATPMQVYQDAVPEIEWAYPSTDYYDELVLGSAFTALATRNISWVSQALDQYADAGYPTDQPILNWDQKAPLCPVVMARVALSLPGSDSRLNVSQFQTAAETFLDSLVAGDLSGTSKTDGGLTWYRDYSDSASLNPALNGAVLALAYADLATTSDKSASYIAYAKNQTDYALGDNPLNAVYVVGLSPNSATNPHSSLASGGNSLNTINTVPRVEKYVLYGGVVGGPNKQDLYYDIRDDYDQTEPALDIVAPMLVIAAANIAQGTSATDPYYVGLTEARIIPKRGSGGLSGGAIAGIVVAVLVVVALVVAFCLWFFWWRKRGGASGRRLTRRRKW